MKLRHKLQQAYSNNPQRIMTCSGFLSRQEILRLRYGNDDSSIAQLVDAGHLSYITNFSVSWRKYLLRWGSKLSPILSSFHSQGESHGP